MLNELRPVPLANLYLNWFSLSLLNWIIFLFCLEEEVCMSIRESAQSFRCLCVLHILKRSTMDKGIL